MVRYTGFARYDHLHDLQTKKQILIMPTWRKSLARMAYSGKSIADTEFIRRWNSLLNNRTLLDAAEQAGVDILFYPHYELQKFLGLFSSAGKNVTIADALHYDVQPLLKESALLVTDYSSVHFDFAYMKKPCVYYQFDPDAFFTQQYRKGYFDFETMGFGEVTDSEDALCGILIDYIRNGFAENEKFKQRCAAFFPLHDKNNCRRIYEEILRLDP
ncbi:MAG: CDP-glycerol glycerophosphotransferase family protein [Clostridia bacterium]|nr:CDP-glycerol glycerophosphotransferase family protein [Clostridia bacterium]